MLIRHKVVISFIAFSGLLLSLFSVYIYVGSAQARKVAFIEALKNKALLTSEIYELHDEVAERTIVSITEQSEYVFDENDQLIYALNDLHDFTFDPSFFNEVRKQGEHTFSYTNRLDEHKEGYAFLFSKEGKTRVVAVTAYNEAGMDVLQSLQWILIGGNFIFLIGVGLAAFAFSNYAFRPINSLVTQAESATGHDLGFRLKYANEKDEVGIVASSFNNALARIQKMAESQKSFISYASHELRTPLAAINGILDTSLNYDKDERAMRESLEAAHKEIRKAVSLVNGLLQLAKIEPQDAVVEMYRINIVDILLDAIEFYRIKMPTQEFAFNIPEASTGTAIEMQGNPGLLRTAIINLIDNASKYSGKQKIEIKLGESAAGVVIKVIDRGVGLANVDDAKLFEPFYRGNNTMGVEGFGLGLPLTDRIATLHKGRITLKSNEFSGVTAELFLPAAFSRTARD